MHAAEALIVLTNLPDSASAESLAALLIDLAQAEAVAELIPHVVDLLHGRTEHRA